MVYILICEVLLNGGIMNKKRIIILTVSLIAIIGIIVGVSYAFFSIGGSQEQANTFTSGCLNISLTDASASISLNNIYPITDVEGLEGTSYDFTITNTCNTSANYQINLESINQASNSLSPDYIKVSLSSDTVDNVISILSNNTSVTPEIDNAYESFNLYTGTLGASETKTYHLKLWLDYDATVEQAANRVYQSKINVIANPETQVVDNLEATFSLEGTTLTSHLTNNVTSASYCITEDNICTPNTSAIIENNGYSIKLWSNKNSQIVCTRLNETSKLICGNPTKITVKDVILADNPTIDDSRNGGITESLTENTTGTLFTAEDDWGTSYVYAGDVDNNWVSFAGYYWRIIRINGDGTIRLIYSGDTESGPVETGEDTQIGISVFNEQHNDNAYLGYMYGTPESNTYEETHANINDSTIKMVLDNWYESNLIDYKQYISTEAGFCNDREIFTDTSSWVEQYYGILGYGNESTIYDSRFGKGNTAAREVQNPTLKCSQINQDLFTTSTSSKGNHALTNPIGLINTDELVLAGGFMGSNNINYYLYTGNIYWTMYPGVFSGGYAYIHVANEVGNIHGGVASSTYGVRPVINLSADVTISSGDGTMDNPYVIAT